MKPKQTKKIESPHDLRIGLKQIQCMDYISAKKLEMRVKFYPEPDIGSVYFNVNKPEAKQIGEWFLKLSEALEE